MTEPLYLIDGSDCLSHWRIARHEAVTEPFLVSLYTGGSTLTLSPSDAIALSRGLAAVGTGMFEVAETELSIAMRAAAKQQREAIQAANRARTDAASHPPHPKPTLESL